MRSASKRAGLFCESNNRIAPAVFRVNTLKASREEAIESLKAEGIETAPSPWLRTGPEGKSAQAGHDRDRRFPPRLAAGAGRGLADGFLYARSLCRKSASSTFAPVWASSRPTLP